MYVWGKAPQPHLARGRWHPVHFWVTSVTWIDWPPLPIIKWEVGWEWSAFFRLWSLLSKHHNTFLSWRKKELFSIRKAGRFYPYPVYENFRNLTANKENSCWFYGHIEKWEKCRTPAGEPAVWLWLFCIMFKGCQNTAFGRFQFSCGCLRWKIGWICPSLSPSLLSLLGFL